MAGDTESVRVLDPDKRAREISPHERRHSTATAWLRLAGALIAIGAVLGLLMAVSPSTGMTPASGPEDAPLLAAAISDVEAATHPDPTEVFERFVSLVNRGDSAAAAELVADELPDVVGLGVAQWPHLPTNVDLWSDGKLSHDALSGFVRYVFTTPGSVLLSECRDAADGPRVVIVTCAYATSGGVLAALGGQPEHGRVHGFMVGGKVAGTVRHGDTDTDLWERLAAWAATMDADPSGALIAVDGGRWQLDPVYNGDTAVIHESLAVEMAAALKDDAAALRMLGSSFGRGGAPLTSPSSGSVPWRLWGGATKVR